MNVSADSGGGTSRLVPSRVFPTMARDLERRSHEIAWPSAFDPTRADWFSRNEAHIEASPRRAWDVLIAAPAWPTWYALCSAFEIMNGSVRLALGSRFRWTTFGMTVEGTVEVFDAPNRICWTGYEPGAAPTFYHAWLISPADTGCTVTYEESGHGPVAATLRDRDEAAMHRGHELLLAGLRWAAEQPSA